MTLANSLLIDSGDVGRARTVRVGGIHTACLTKSELVGRMIDDCYAARGGTLLPKLVFASNGSVIARYHKEPSFKALVDQADIIDADGMPLIHASRILASIPLPERIATTDFVIDASEAAISSGLRFYFLGGREEDSCRAYDYFTERFPGLKLVGRRNGYFQQGEEASICEEIRYNGVDVLWVGLGSPLQESFAVRNRSRLQGVGWIRTCGGLLDYYSGRSPRAPLWMQKAALEWLFRSVLEPRRLGSRYLRTNVPALYHLLTKTG
ncbi:WecB/TagA/CpsF family glycosyltransferase [Microvirga soli]|uniref:WecB/TagA/CpsF family glycosyltransferase n=1 Tax=Microvirga soli TaxID=1854496 RepID=UPI001FE8599B|nr:WecB/TagA/CpsF family glycosyltransferase [Microvirga soli]